MLIVKSWVGLNTLVHMKVQCFQLDSLSLAPRKFPGLWQVCDKTVINLKLTFAALIQNYFYFAKLNESPKSINVNIMISNKKLISLIMTLDRNSEKSLFWDTEKEWLKDICCLKLKGFSCSESLTFSLLKMF